MDRLDKGRRKLLAAMLATGLLAGCGFHMRGNADFAFKRLYIGIPPNTLMGSDLRRAIRGGSDTAVVSDQKEADALLDVLQDTRTKTILSITTEGVVREYRLTQRFSFRLRDAAGKELIPPSQLVLTRDLTYNEANTLAKDYEEQQLYRDMQRDIVQQLMRRLAAVKVI
ncbi:LPS-assembly lipoprotein LptE [Cupriavidus yeoncheonensis]|uniref:LPS-assembly lipoprotein LptE n=1 Tax=Cupriavidus yeoncheonensis TaxID=1462994 RepID=A0A916MW79_9BURK|nr:LPS assembly lipoprotein LptE [Cupriavidus yeoncheonensis]CAG2130047.1 LPS-assembly lipoprotein LptE [Cupriavidus yeoncheonensis]